MNSGSTTSTFNFTCVSWENGIIIGNEAHYKFQVVDDYILANTSASNCHLLDLSSSCSEVHHAVVSDLCCSPCNKYQSK